jgi:L-asparaginase II
MSGTELSPKQRKAIAALLAFGEIQLAAEHANCSRGTLYAWLKQPAFLAALKQAEADALRSLTRKLVGLGSRATGVIEATMTEPGVSPAVRLKAADTVLARLLQLRELIDLEERVSSLEERLEATNGNR